MKFDRRLIGIFILFFAQNLWSIVSFDESMGSKHTGKYKELFREVYDANNYEKATYSKKPKIPKIIHQIWIGDDPVPQVFIKWMESWKEKNPDWQYKLWTNEDISSFPFINKRTFMYAKNMGMKTDIWRLEILHKYGGLYVDTDFECLTPMDIFHHTCSFYAGFAHSYIVANGLIGAAPGHPILKACIKQIGNKIFKVKHIDDVQRFTGCFLLTAKIQIFAQNKKSPRDVIIYPTTFFYPMPSGLRYLFWKNKSTTEQFYKSETAAMHYWATSWCVKR